MNVSREEKTHLKTGILLGVYPKSLIKTLVLLKSNNKMFSAFPLLSFQLPLLSFFKVLTMLLRDQNRRRETLK